MGFIATILAGGEGKRMRSDLPKVLHLFDGRPMLVRIIEQVRILSPHKIVIVTGKHHAQITNTLAEYIDITGIQFVEQPVPLGTGNAVAHCLDHYTTNENVLILNGDMPLLSCKIIENLIEASAGFDGAIVTARLDYPAGYGRIISNGSSIIGIIEESSCTRYQKAIVIVNAGIYYFKANVLKTYIPRLSNNNFKKEYYLTDIIKDACSEGRSISTYLLEGDENIAIRGVNSPEELAELHGILFKIKCQNKTG